MTKMSVKVKKTAKTSFKVKNMRKICLYHLNPEKVRGFSERRVKENLCAILGVTNFFEKVDRMLMKSAIIF
jgi:hypothetical protein